MRGGKQINIEQIEHDQNSALPKFAIGVEKFPNQFVAALKEANPLIVFGARKVPPNLRNSLDCSLAHAINPGRNDGSYFVKLRSESSHPSPELGAII